GTILLQETPQKDSRLIVDNGGRSGTNTSWTTGGPSVDLTLINGAAMTLPTTTLRSLFIGSNSRLQLANATITVTSNAVIEAGGSLYADGLGWAAGSGPGAGRYFSGGTAGGAGHGGYGGQGSDPRMSGGNTYGSLSAPVDNGSGGGSAYSYYSGGPGGGAIRLNVSGSLTVNGTISANGGDASAYGSGGGSGGSIWLTCHTLAGSGVIGANGGAGQNAGGGGGGRIALQLTYDTFTGRCTAIGGGGNSIGGAGTIYIQNSKQSYNPQVIVDNGGQRGANTSWSGSTPIHLTVCGGGIVAPQSALKLESLLLSTNGWIRTTTQQPLTVTKDAFIEAGGGIVADGSGTLSPAPGLLNGGGGHGGYGGGNGGNAYGSITAPRDQGGAGTGGNLGGGVVDLTVHGTLLLNGRISANGNDAAGAGAGAGGSVRLSPNSFTGSGSISANGGAGLYGGGGGRVAVSYGLNTFTGTISACGGGAPEHSGGAGTVFLQGRNLQTGTLIVDNCGQPGTNTLLTPFPNGSDLVIRGGAIAWPSTSSLVVSNLSLQQGGTLTGQRLSTNLDVIVLGNALIDPSACISVDGKGFSAMAGPGAGFSMNSIGSGAGHGGQGGASSLQPGGAAYGSVEQPLERGSGGGLGYSLPIGGSQGGGALRLNVNGSLLLNGRISANGNPGLGDDSGGGSGGSILILANTLSGEGRIEAHGGDGQLYTGGGGAGGRIALYSPVNFFSGNSSASGGDGFAEGSTGSVFYSASPLALQVVGQSLSGTVIQPVSAIDLQFNTPLNLASLSPADFSIHTPTGILSEVAFTTPTPASLRLAFPQQIAEGAYNLALGPDVRNVYGQPMPAAFNTGFNIVWPVISGRVTDSDDRPVSDVHLQAGTLLSTRTDANGVYTFKAPPWECFSVQPSLGNSLFVPSSRTYCATGDAQNQDYLLVDSVSPTLTKTFQTNGISLEWQGIPGITYQVMYSSDLIEWSYWWEGITCTPTNRWVKIFIPRDDSPQRFFRLQGSY
ncbi:MAG TPA: carboxypeptidase-like regulatory domain-containing protein, partial [Clostridia bacterium]|nr:carboxypeptidase-like regulatory domain-containing protein [Clostridia bacterium]